MRAQIATALASLVRADTEPLAPVGAVIALGAGHELLNAARRHRVVAFLRPVLEQIDDTPTELLAEAWATESYAVRAHQRALDELARLTEILGKTPFLVFKGPVAATLLYERPELRPYRDLDVLVPGRSFATAVRRLEEGGYRVIDRNWAMIRRDIAGQLHLQRHGGVGVDLHWDLVYGEPLRARFAIDTDGLFADGHPVRLRDLCVPTFGPVAMLVHLCVHACREGGDRLLWFTDIAAAARRVEDWDGVVRLARAWRVHLLVGTMLARATATTGDPLPGEVLAALLPSRSHRWLIRALDRRFPVAGTSERGSPATLVARATRATVAATLAETVRGIGRRSSRALRSGTLTRSEARRDPTDPGSTLHPSGGSEDRDAYFSRVAANRGGSR